MTPRPRHRVLEGMGLVALLAFAIAAFFLALVFLAACGKPKTRYLPPGAPISKNWHWHPSRGGIAKMQWIPVKMQWIPGKELI